MGIGFGNLGQNLQKNPQLEQIFMGRFLSVLLGITAGGALLATPGKAQVITLQQAIENAMANNIQIKQGQFNSALSDETLKQSKYALLPAVNGSANYSKNFGRSIDVSTNQFINKQFSSASGSLNASVDLFAGFQKLNQIKQNKLLLDADKTNVEKIKNDLVLQVVTAYMQILYNKDLLTASQQQLEVASQTAKREEALLNAGNKTLADVSQAKSQVATAELNVTNAQNNLAISYLTLNQLMEQASDTKFDVQAPTVDASIKIADSLYNATAIYKAALGTFPDIRLANLRTQAAQKAIAVARGSYSPRLSLGGGIGSNYSSGRQRLVGVTQNGFRPIGVTQNTNEPVVTPDYISTFAEQTFTSQIKDNFNQFVGLSVSIPIFNGFNARTNVRRAKINHQNSQAQEQLTKNNLNKVINQAVVDAKAAASRYESTLNAFNAQKDAYYVVEQRYEVGLVNSLDYNTAQTNRNKAELDFIQAKYDLIFKTKVIDYYLGKPIVF